MPLIKPHKILDIPVIPWKECIAKSLTDGSPGLSVIEHSRNVAEVARSLMAILPRSVQILMGDVAVVLAALHDVGKVSPGFQKKILGNFQARYNPQIAKYTLSNFETRHARISEAALNAFLGAEYETMDISAVVGAHHGVRDGTDTLLDSGSIFGGKEWMQERRKLIVQLLKEYGHINRNSALNIEALTGLVCVADWIGSDESFFPPDQNSLLRLLHYNAFDAWSLQAIAIKSYNLIMSGFPKPVNLHLPKPPDLELLDLF